MRFKYMIIISLLLITITACGKKKPGQFNQKRPEKAYNVLVKEIIPQDIVEYVNTTGKLEGITDIQMRSQVSGKIISLNKDLGDWVNKGDEIGKIDNEDYEISLKQANAGHLAAKANLKSAKMRFQNSQELYKKDQISQMEFVQAESAFEQAKSGLESAAASLERASKNLRYSKFTAPVSGRISYIPIKVGETISMGNLICTIVNAKQLIINSGVGENEVIEIRNKIKKVIVQHPNLKEDIIGKIVGVGIKPSMNSINYPIKIKLNNVDDQLLPGMIVNIKINSGTYEDKLIIPSNNVMKKYDDRYVFVVKNNVAYKTSIELGKQIDGDVIVESGLNAGDLVVLDGAENLSDKSRVIVKKAVE